MNRSDFVIGLECDVPRGAVLSRLGIGIDKVFVRVGTREELLAFGEVKLAGEGELTIQEVNDDTWHVSPLR